MSTLTFVWILLIAGLVLEAVTLVRRDLRTISQAVKAMKDDTPFAIYALAALVGHWGVQPPSAYTPANVMPEVAEVGTVAAIGGIVFVWGQVRGEAKWWEPLLVILLGVLAGAFVWTMRV